MNRRKTLMVVLTLTLLSGLVMGGTPMVEGVTKLLERDLVHFPFSQRFENDQKFLDYQKLQKEYMSPSNVSLCTIDTTQDGVDSPTDIVIRFYWNISEGEPDYFLIGQALDKATNLSFKYRGWDENFVGSGDILNPISYVYHGDVSGHGSQTDRWVEVQVFAEGSGRITELYHSYNTFGVHTYGEAVEITQELVDLIIQTVLDLRGW